MPAAFRPDPDAVCDACGAAEAFRFDGETLCADCYAGRGSCCSPEFSGQPCTRPPSSAAESPGAKISPGRCRPQDYPGETLTEIGGCTTSS